MNTGRFSMDSPRNPDNVPPNLPNTLRQYIADEREALERSQDVRP